MSGLLGKTQFVGAGLKKKIVLRPFTKLFTTLSIVVETTIS